jgi:hypothetical protein
MKSRSIIFIALFFSLAAFAENHYICYNCTTNKKLQICICFENNNAIWIKYKGQLDSIPLFFVNRNWSGNEIEIAYTRKRDSN